MQSVFRQVQDKQTCALRGLCSCAVYPSTGSGRTACNLPRPFLAPLALRLGSGERQCFAESLLLRCSPFDRLRANGLPSARDLTCTFHPSARLRGNGGALQGPYSYAVHPSTGSGRTVMCCRQRGSLASPNRTVKQRAMGLLECPVTPMLPCAACRACGAPGRAPRPMAVGSNCVRR